MTTTITARMFSTSSQLPIAEVKLDYTITEENFLDIQITKTHDAKIINRNDKLISPCRTHKGEDRVSDAICTILKTETSDTAYNVLKEFAFTVLETVGSWPNSTEHKYFTLKIYDLQENEVHTYIFDNELNNETAFSIEPFAEQELPQQAAAI